MKSLLNIVPLYILSCIIFISCTKTSNTRCPNDFINSVGTNVKDCTCKPGYNIDIENQYFYNYKPRSFDGYDCIKRNDYNYIHNFDKSLIVFSKIPFGNKAIENGEIIIERIDNTFITYNYWLQYAFNTIGITNVPLPHTQPYFSKVLNYNYVPWGKITSSTVIFRDYEDSFHIDLRQFGDYGHTTNGEGIFISFGQKITTTAGRTSKISRNFNIQLTAPGDDSSFVPIRTIPIDDIREE